MKYRLIIGLEVHVQLNTKTKLFCSCLNEYAPDEPNKNICEFCTGQPGALPLLNKEAVKKAINFGVAVGANIPEKTRWDRKNYFYPDLPAGYQISQYDNPIVEGGKIEFYIENKNTGEFTQSSVELTRAHLEMDAAKLLHLGKKSMVDFNRSGAPLIEIVTEPVIHSTDQAMAFINELQLLVRTINISDADLDKGQMRFDCNISLQNPDQEAKNELPPYRVEIKNINSIRSLGRAIEYEIKRQSEILEEGKTPDQETRGWRDDLNISETQRSKEDAMDYRYFPEPDLLILEISREEIPSVESLPAMPANLRQEYLDKGLNLQIANTFLTKPETRELFVESTKIANNPKLEKTIANLITVNLLGASTKEEKDINQILTPKQIADTAELFFDKKISNRGLEKVIEELSGEDKNDVEVINLVEEKGLIQVSDDTALKAFVEVVLTGNPDVVNQYKEGKIQVIGFLVGQCMKESRGKGNPAKFKEILEVELAK